MYGLKQAALLAYNNLKDSLEPHGYSPIVGTVGMWEHKTRSRRLYINSHTPSVVKKKKSVRLQRRCRLTESLYKEDHGAVGS